MIIILSLDQEKKRIKALFFLFPGTKKEFLVAQHTINFTIQVEIYIYIYVQNKTTTTTTKKASLKLDP